MTHNEKYETMKKNGLCFKCLGKHLRTQCKAFVKCDVCSKGHLTVMHRDFSEKKSIDEDKNESFQEAHLCSRVCGSSNAGYNCSKTVLVDVTVSGHLNRKIRCYAIVDEQSSSSFADKRLAEYFDIRSPVADYSLTTLTGLITKQSGIQLIGLRIKGVGETKSYKLPTLLTNTGIPCNKSEVATPEKVEAHPHIAHLAKFFNKVSDEAETLLLLGRDSSDAMYTCCYGQRAPFAHHTRLGWALVGQVCRDDGTSDRKVLRTTLSHEHFSANMTFSSNINKDDIPLILDVFDEHAPDEQTALSKDDQKFLEIVQDNIAVNNEGFISMPLPFKQDKITFPDNRKAVLNRTQNSLNRIKKDKSKLEKCITAMQGHIDSNHVELAPTNEVKKETWYIPVFPVTHPKKQKVRLVFDSSAKFQDTSLNDMILSGPDLINRLKTVLIRFRKALVGFAADIESMFYCFFLDEKDRDKTRFFWFAGNCPSAELVEYRGTCHLFGNTSSPALAIMGIHYAVCNPGSAASDEVPDFVTKHFYVDDGIMSTESEEEAVSILKMTQEALTKYNIRLHKITSNSPEVLRHFPEEDLSKTSATTFGSSQQTLGLTWEITEDKLVVNSLVPDKPFTKRGILAVVNSILIL